MICTHKYKRICRKIISHKLPISKTTLKAPKINRPHRIIENQRKKYDTLSHSNITLLQCARANSITAENSTRHIYESTQTHIRK